MTVTVPVVALRVVEKVSVLVPVAGFGLNEAVVPLRKPDTDSETLPLKPLKGVTVIVVAPLLPRKILRLAGDADRLKFGADTVSETFVEWLKLPLTPVMVTVKVPVVAVAPAVKVNVLTLVVLTVQTVLTVRPRRPSTGRRPCTT